MLGFILARWTYHSYIIGMKIIVVVFLQDEMFQKFNFDTEWAVRLISRITNNEDIPIEGHTILLGIQINAGKYYFGIRKILVEFDEVLVVSLLLVTTQQNFALAKLTPLLSVCVCSFF
ncbi:putative protein translocase subunit SecA [Dioscorea sansibarensis]